MDPEAATQLFHLLLIMKAHEIDPAAVSFSERREFLNVRDDQMRDAIFPIVRHLELELINVAVPDVN